MKPIGLAIIGTGRIALENHLPGLALLPTAKVVALCDTDPATLERAARLTGVSAAFVDYQHAIAHDGVDAVIIATPNFTHARIALDAIDAGKHVLCEKPLAINMPDALEVVHRAEAKGVRHMIAFTYRFVPAMVYMSHLVKTGAAGQIHHFRAQRFQDWGSRHLGWRQTAALAGSGELGDMLSHRIDLAHLLVGPIRRLTSALRNLLPVREGEPSDVDDWVAVLAEFHAGATGVFESTKLATGHGEGSRSHDWCEINGSDATLVYRQDHPHELLIGHPARPGLEPLPVPEAFLKHPATPRDPRAGDPLVTFRYDQSAEFIDAILTGRPCSPSFIDGLAVQRVMDAILLSNENRRWVELAINQPASAR